MGSKITRALNQNQRRQVVKSNSVPTLIKAFMWGLSLAIGFSMGYVMHSHLSYSNGKQLNSLQKTAILIPAVTLTTVIKLNNLLLRSVMLLFFAIFFGSYFSLFIIGAIQVIFLCIAIIVFGQLISNSSFPLFMVSFVLSINAGLFVADKVQITRNQTLQIYKQSQSILALKSTPTLISQSEKQMPTITIQAVFGVVIIMCSILFSNAMFHTKTKHSAPIPIKYIFQLFKIHRETIYYGAIIFLISVCTPQPLLNYFFSPKATSGLIILILPTFLLLKYKFAKFSYFVICLIISALNMIMIVSLNIPDIFESALLGFINVILFQAMSSHRILGLAVCSISLLFGQIIRKQFVDESQYKQTIQGLLILYAGLAYIVKQFSKTKSSKKQYQRLNNPNTQV